MALGLFQFFIIIPLYWKRNHENIGVYGNACSFNEYPVGKEAGCTKYSGDIADNLMIP